jgi:hypothetical protein
VWIKLRGQEASRAAHKKRKTEAEGNEDATAALKDDPIDGRDIYININKLYLLMDQDPDLKVWPRCFPNTTPIGRPC